jgi:hypothetical protein
MKRQGFSIFTLLFILALLLLLGGFLFMARGARSERTFKAVSPPAIEVKDKVIIKDKN